MKTPTHIIYQAQQVLAKHLPPDGISAEQTIAELLHILDGQDAVLMTTAHREVVHDVRHQAVVTIEHRERLDAAEAVSTMAAKVARLEDQVSELQENEAKLIEHRDRLAAELERKREAENKLIADRDRLIHKDIAGLHAQNQQVSIELAAVKAKEDQLTAERDELCKDLNTIESLFFGGQVTSSFIGDGLPARIYRASISRDELLNAARAERDDARAAVSRFSERLAKAEAELMASQERERMLSERLSSIASLVTDM